MSLDNLVGISLDPVTADAAAAHRVSEGWHLRGKLVLVVT